MLIIIILNLQYISRPCCWLEMSVLQGNCKKHVTSFTIGTILLIVFHVLESVTCEKKNHCTQFFLSFLSKFNTLSISLNLNAYRQQRGAAWDFACSPHVYVGLFNALQFPTASKTHASRWIGYVKLPQCLNKCVTTWCLSVDWHLM